MQTLRQDISYAMRQMRLSPVFTLTAMLTLALGIGATTAIFSLIHSVMLKSLPVVDPSRLYRIVDGNDCCVQGGPQGSVCFPQTNLQRGSELAHATPSGQTRRFCVPSPTPGVVRAKPANAGGIREGE